MLFRSPPLVQSPSCSSSAVGGTLLFRRKNSHMIDEFKKVNKIMGVEFADRLKKVVDEYNNRRRDEAYAAGAPGFQVPEYFA